MKKTEIINELTDRVTTQFKEHIITLIDFDTYDVDETKSKMDNLVEVFKSEYGFMIQRVGLRKSLIGWLEGLPSVIKTPYKPNEIINLMYATGMIQTRDVDISEVREITERYYEAIALIIAVDDNYLLTKNNI